MSRQQQQQQHLLPQLQHPPPVVGHLQLTPLSSAAAAGHPRRRHGSSPQQILCDGVEVIMEDGNDDGAPCVDCGIVTDDGSRRPHGGSEERLERSLPFLRQPHRPAAPAAVPLPPPPPPPLLQRTAVPTTGTAGDAAVRVGSGGEERPAAVCPALPGAPGTWPAALSKEGGEVGEEGE